MLVGQGECDLPTDDGGKVLGNFECGVVPFDGFFDLPSGQVWQVAVAVLATTAQEVAVDAAASAFGFGVDEAGGPTGRIAALAVERTFQVVAEDAVAVAVLGAVCEHVLHLVDELIKDEADRIVRLEAAQRAVANLRSLTEKYADVLTDRERVIAEREARRAQAEAHRSFSDEVEQQRKRFLTLQEESNAQRRGKDFEVLLTDLFVLFDMEPRLSYDLAREQIDGSLTFDTDDYIIEARWRSETASREDADVFATKVRRKGKNALGLFVSVKGLSKDAQDEYSHSTPFMAVDGRRPLFGAGPAETAGRPAEAEEASRQ